LTGLEIGQSVFGIAMCFFGNIQFKCRYFQGEQWSEKPENAQEFYSCWEIDQKSGKRWGMIMSWEFDSC